MTVDCYTCGGREWMLLNLVQGAKTRRGKPWLAWLQQIAEDKRWKIKTTTL